MREAQDAERELAMGQPFGVTHKIVDGNAYVTFLFDSRDAWLENAAHIGVGVSSTLGQSRRNAEQDAELPGGDTVLYHKHIGIMKVVSGRGGA